MATTTTTLPHGTTPPPVPPFHLQQRQASSIDPQLIGFWDNGTDWDAINCDTDQEYFTSGSYAACAQGQIQTECTIGRTQTASDGSLTCNADASCITITIHNETPAPQPDPQQRTHLLCAQAWNAFTVYRETTTTDSSSSSSSAQASTSASIPTATPDSSTSSASSSSSSFSSSSTSSPPTNSAIQAAATESSSSTNPGLIAGPVVAGVALLLVIAFLIWFFRVHRKKNNKTPELDNPYMTQNEPVEAYSYSVPNANAPPSEMWAGEKYAHAGVGGHELEQPRSELPGHQIDSTPRELDVRR